jgi:hypothetical protein
MQSRLAFLTAALLGLAHAASAQQWTLTATLPAVTFGVSGNLLVHDGTDWMGYDEVAALTLLGTTTGFVGLPAPIPPRQGAALAASVSHVYLFGGDDPTNGPSNGLWRFQRATGWSMMTLGGATAPGPSPRSGCRFTTIGGWYLTCFGGLDANGLPNDTWLMLDVAGLPLWSQVAGPSPGGRLHHAMAPGPNFSAVLFGGIAGTTLGDTWILRPTGWVAHTGTGPPAAADARMVYDSGRAVTVLVHPNGDTWEWDDYRWRRVGAVGAPSWNLPAVAHGPVPGTTAFQPGPNGLQRYSFLASPAAFETTLDITCQALPGIDITLQPFERSLPVLGQTLHLRASGVPVTSFFVGVYEFAGSAATQLGCSCMLGVNGVAAGLQFVPGTTTARDWLLPVAPLPALHGLAIDVQGIVVGTTQPCFAMTTSRGTITPGW